MYTIDTMDLKALVLSPNFCLALALVVAYVVREHWGLFVSLARVVAVTPYGVSTEFNELISRHLWYFVKGYFVRDRNRLLANVEDSFRSVIKPEDGTNLMITHSCRVIFMCVIQTLLDEAEERTGRRKIRICTASVHFGSFYKLLKALNNSGKGEIEYYEVDFRRNDWTLDQTSVKAAEVQKCDLILGQHIFGVPLDQEVLFELGKRFNIPIMEDNVQCGSMFGKYKGHTQTDVVMWSGGLDKTPSTMGGGFGAFRPTQHGSRLFEKCQARHSGFPIDSFRSRFVSILKQSVHLMVAKNTFFIDHVLSILAYFMFSKRGDYVKFYPMALRVRQDKSLAPFEHAVDKFSNQPSVPHLMSLWYGLGKLDTYDQVSRLEIARRDLLLRCTPCQYHSKLFPWLTEDVQRKYKENIGISEFSWVASEVGHRLKLCEFLNDHFVIALINTSWEYHSPKSVGAEINENLVYLPNLNETNEAQVMYLGHVLTQWCEFEYEGVKRP